MDVMEILKQSSTDLLPDELEMLVTELDTGEYAADYISACKTLIQEIRNRSHKEPEPASRTKTTPGSAKRSPDSSSSRPASISAVTLPSIPPEKIVSSDLQRMRTERDYKNTFKKYVKTSSIINEAFIVSQFSLFKEWELSAMLSCIMFSEDYLENYFGILDHKMIAQYQLFSESFYMRHFADLDAETVLSKGVNPWRDKAQRSNHLDMFLRIKGVKL